MQVPIFNILTTELPRNKYAEKQNTFPGLQASLTKLLLLQFQLLLQEGALVAQRLHLDGTQAIFQVWDLQVRFFMSQNHPL